ncbi:MAG: endo-1,4-beta-xylanase [Planctomycetota bacterium]
MGVLRFLIQPASMFETWPEVHRAYISGFDQSVHTTRVELEDSLLVCRRQVSESGKLNVAWPVAGFGKPMISTASLPERQTPYLLPLELARGKIVQLRNQLATWEAAGMQLPVGYANLSASAHSHFAKAVGAQNDLPRCAELANLALQSAFQAAELLTQSYAQQSLAVRHRRYSQIPTLVGAYLPHELDGPWQSQYLDAFNTGAVSVKWRNIEPVEGEYHWELFDAQVDWCEDNRLVIRGGPLLDLAPQGMPEWLFRWENDIWNLQSFVCDFVETAIRRYQGRVRMWEVAARGNSGGGMAITEENRLGLVAKALEIARQVDEEAQIFIRIDQPWAEYQARGQHRLSPMQFADGLIRAGLGLSGINLEIAVGYAPRGSASRDLLEYSRLIDLWSVLGLPLHVTLAFPSASGPDPQANCDLEVEPSNWKHGWSEESQAEWIDSYLPLLIAKPAVTGVFWNHLSDASPHIFPHAGLINAAGHVKPGLQRIARHRQNYLK